MISTKWLEAVLRWVARAWSIASTLLLLAFAFGGHEHVRLTGSEAMAFLLFPVGVIAGFAIAWWRELAGGFATMGSLALFYLLMFARTGDWPGGPYFLLFAAPGFLYVAKHLITPPQRRGATRENAASGMGGNA